MQVGGRFSVKRRCCRSAGQCLSQCGNDITSCFTSLDHTVLLTYLWCFITHYSANCMGVSKKQIWKVFSSLIRFSLALIVITSKKFYTGGREDSAQQAFNLQSMSLCLSMRGACRVRETGLRQSRAHCCTRSKLSLDTAGHKEELAAGTARVQHRARLCRKPVSHTWHG